MTNDIEKVFGKFRKENPAYRKIVESEEYKRGGVVSEARIAMKLTQHEFAKLCHVSDRTIHRLEGGDHGIDQHEVDKVLAKIDAFKKSN